MCSVVVLHVTIKKMREVLGTELQIQSIANFATEKLNFGCFWRGRVIEIVSQICVILCRCGTVNGLLEEGGIPVQWCFAARCKKKSTGGR